MMAMTLQEEVAGSQTKQAIVRSEGARPGAAAAPVDETVAVLVCHGMGQQVPFETIDSVARVLRKAVVSENPGTEPPKIEVGLVSFPESERPLPRAALHFKTADGKSRALHVYEAYWAPLTEGKITLRDVMTFLFSAGIGGLLKARRRFWRWMFGDWQDFGRPVLAPFFLALALLVVIALIAMNSTIVAVTVARALTQAKPTWPSNGLVADLTITFSILLTTAAVLAIVFLLARWRHRRHEEANEGWTLRESWLRLWLTLSVIAVWVTIIVTIGVGVLLVLQLNWHLEVTDVKSMWWATENWLTTSLHYVVPLSIWNSALQLHAFDESTARRIFVTAVWAFIALASYGVRTLLVQYPGDVAAYVSSHEASKFCDIRIAIHKAAVDVAKAIYGAKNASGAFVYDRLVVVGHSLGSVVAYDTLNALIGGDSLDGNKLWVADRTAMFLTFGSPLDKTAYVFRNQKPIEAEVREALAAHVQPMILDYKNRPARWVNLYSNHDWISGALGYYDDMKQTAHKSKWIENVIDRYACIHVMAHTQYWAGPFFASYLYEGVTGNEAPNLRAVADRGLVNRVQVLFHREPRGRKHS